MAQLIDDVLDYLEAQGLIRGATGWSGFANYLPPTPDQVIAVFPTPGLEPEEAPAGSTETEYDYPGFQVRGRGTVFGSSALLDKLGAVFRSLHGSTLSPAGGDPIYVYVYAVQSGPLPLGHDQNDRPEFTWNFRAMRERESS